MWPFSQWMEQLFHLLKPSDPYYHHWVRFRQGLFLRQWGGCIVAPLFIGLILLLAWWLPLLVAAWIAAGAIAALLMLAYVRYPLKCPSCKRPFYGHLEPRRHAYTMERCLQCGLQLYAPQDE